MIKRVILVSSLLLSLFFLSAIYLFGIVLSFYGQLPQISLIGWRMSNIQVISHISNLDVPLTSQSRFAYEYWTKMLGVNVWDTSYIIDILPADNLSYNPKSTSAPYTTRLLDGDRLIYAIGTPSKIESQKIVKIPIYFSDSFIKSTNNDNPLFIRRLLNNLVIKGILINKAEKYSDVVFTTRETEILRKLSTSDFLPLGIILEGTAVINNFPWDLLKEIRSNFSLKLIKEIFAQGCCTLGVYEDFYECSISGSGCNNPGRRCSGGGGTCQYVETQCVDAYEGDLDSCNVGAACCYGGCSCGGGEPTPTPGGEGGGVQNPLANIKGQKVSNLAPLPPEVNSATVHGCWASNSEPEDYCAYGFDISNNPYSSGPTRNGRWDVWVDVPAGCTVGYTTCENSTGCESNPPTPGNSVTFRCGSGDVWDVWWHFNCGPPPPPLPCPSGISRTCAPEGDSVNFSWNPLAGAVRYMLRLNKDPGWDWFNAGGGDQARENTATSMSFNITPDSNYTWDVQGIRAGEAYPYSGARCPFEAFSCLVSSIPSCAVSLNPLPAMSVGQSIKLIPNVNQANGTVDEVTFTINASSTGTAVLCADDLNYTNPCSPGALTYVDNVTGFSAKLSLLTPGTIVVDVAGRMLDDPPAPPYNCTGGSGSGDVAGPPPWWQVIGGDIWSGSTSIGSIYSPIPSSSLFPFLIRDNPTNHPGIPAAGSTINLSSGEPSSQGWVAQNVPYLNTDSYSYDFFEKKIPSQVLSNIETTVNENTLENGGFSYGGYYWFKHTGGSLILDSNDVPNKLISLANRKVIVFVESGDVTINTKIRFGDGVGAFYLIANYNVLIDPEVGGVASNPNRLVDLEGLIFADGQIRTGTRDNDLDQQLYVRGILAGLGIIGNGPIGARDGVDLQRDLPDNSTYPAELIQFAPDLVLNWPPYLSTKHVIWREVAP